MGASLAVSLGTIGADIATLLSRITNSRAGYLDNLSAGAVALASAVAALPTTVINSIQYVTGNAINVLEYDITITAVVVAKTIIIPLGWESTSAVAAEEKLNGRWKLTNTTTVTYGRDTVDGSNHIVGAVVLEFK